MRFLLDLFGQTVITQVSENTWVNQDGNVYTKCGPTLIDFQGDMLNQTGSHFTRQNGDFLFSFGDNNDQR